MTTRKDVSDGLSHGLMRQLLIRLQADPCGACGRTGASGSELETIRKFLLDNDIRDLQKDAADLAHSITDTLPFEEPLFISDSLKRIGSGEDEEC